MQVDVLPAGLLPAVALITGICCGTFIAPSSAAVLWSLPASCLVAGIGWTFRWHRVSLAALVAGYFAAGLTLAADARAEALRPRLRLLLEERIGGFALESLGPERDHDPVVVLLRLDEDASPAEGFVSLRGRVIHVETPGGVIAADGGVLVSVSGAAATKRVSEWRAGRMVRLPATFRRPARYLNEGVQNFERALALGGTSLLGSVKSGLLVDVMSSGSAIAEAAAAVRAHVRDAVARRIASHGPLSAGIVTAVLIGDRSGLPDAIRDRLQRAGTYHVIAISGGNIAILAAAVLGALALAGIRGRRAAAVAIVVLMAYACVATTGPSVLRATLMAVLHLAARVIDHRTAPWQTTLVAAASMVVVHPLDVRDPGFILTFGATAALLEGARRGARLGHHRPPVSWLAASVIASLSAEAALLPVSAQMFSRITVAGPLLNLLAVPLMALVQISGLVVVILDGLGPLADTAALIAHHAATALVDSARLVDIAPWLTRRVPTPGLSVLLIYYWALAAVLFARSYRGRRAGAAALAAAVVMIAVGANPGSLLGSRTRPGALTINVFDVGQGEAILVRTAVGGSLLVDTGGSPFGGGGFDIGARVLAPALWARGISTLDALLVTHGDPDHAGGAESILEDFAPREFWEGIRVPPHRPTRILVDRAVRQGISIHARRAGEALLLGRAHLRVLHPPEPDWERQRVRNDDSVVLEIVHDGVALLLTGDITEEVERSLLPRLTRAPVRVLKVAHHGSRTSTSEALLEYWRPQLAVISAGRGNTFGHPAPEVLRRLEAIGATVLRTDRHGEITLVSDRESVTWRTYVGGGGFARPGK